MKAALQISHGETVLGAARSRYPLCPDCEASMAPHSCNKAILYKCPNCHGLWLTGTRLRIFREALTSFDYSDFEVYWHGGLLPTYVISSCTRCHQVLDEFHYGYNSGVKIYRCGRCQGLWLPLPQVVCLLESLKLSQSLAADLRGFLTEMQTWWREIYQLQRWVQFVKKVYS
jgi:Zn-finger nucleic acid-binding protein